MTTTGMNMREALALARELGCSVEIARGTGEVLVRHPSRPTEVLRVNARRKDAPRNLTSFLRRLEGGADGSAPLA